MGNLPKKGKRIVVAVDVIKVLSLFKVIFQQMIDLFLALHLRIRKNAGCFHGSYQRGKKKEVEEQ